MRVKEILYRKDVIIIMVLISEKYLMKLSRFIRKMKTWI